ncbi:hypothetical protein Bbelb_022070 [Branchiostoma belcheri]|nr:hypothetical protein Bbelb_022070 [Branchiostoma belcheri]
MEAFYTNCGCGKDCCGKLGQGLIYECRQQFMQKNRDQQRAFIRNSLEHADRREESDRDKYEFSLKGYAICWKAWSLAFGTGIRPCQGYPLKCDAEGRNGAEERQIFGGECLPHHDFEPRWMEGSVQDFLRGFDYDVSVCPSSCLGNCMYNCQSQACSCCHTNCIGGCHGPNPEDCVACKYFVQDGKCTEQCTGGTYEYKGRRCITADECPNSSRDGIWKLHHGKCIPECPSGYTTDSENPRLCTECEGQCPKSCKGGLVDSLAAAQRFRGCTIIEEELKISIRGGDNIITELQDNLGLIEEVGQYVAIVRSYALVTLDFLRSLKRIRGQDVNGYAFYVLDNRNLEKLFNWDRMNMTIDVGRLFFHFNPKLCQQVIHTMWDKVGLTGQPSDVDVSTLTNGDQAQCSFHKLVISDMSSGKDWIIVRWEQFLPPDPRDLLSYTVSYRETSEQGIEDEYEGQDACGNTEWRDFDVNRDQTAHIITGLKPWTQYAILVKTYTKAGAREGSGAKSDIVYARTNADKPTHPLDVVVYSNSSNILIITWKPPNRPNGNVTHYIVKYKRQQEDVSSMESRDYCQGGLKPHRPTQGLEDIVNKEEEANNSTTGDGTCCECPKSEDEIRIEEGEAAFQQEFENFLHNNVYHKR